MKRWLWTSACVLSLLAAAGLRAQPAGQSASDPRCVLICVALLQAIGDDMKEQIYLTCNQSTGGCEGSGHIQTVSDRVPVRVTAQLEGNVLDVRIKGAEDVFVTDDADHLAMTVAPDEPRQTAQFVVRRSPLRSSGGAEDGTPLFVTVLVEKLIAP